jgi:hypothetical protein
MLEGKGPLWKRRCDINMKVSFNTGCNGVNWTHLPGMGCYGHSNEPSGFIRSGKFLAR